MKVREMEPDDVEQVAELETEIFQDSWSNISIEESRALKYTICAVAEDESGIDGYMFVYCVADQCEIARIAVDTAARRKGVASALMQYLEQECEKRGVKKILLDVRRSNQGAYSFYLNEYFKEDGIRPNFYRNPQEDAILMSRELSSSASQ